MVFAPQSQVFRSSEPVAAGETAKSEVEIRLQFLSAPAQLEVRAARRGATANVKCPCPTMRVLAHH
jgi:hypothetical protein